MRQQKYISGQTFFCVPLFLRMVLFLATLQLFSCHSYQKIPVFKTNNIPQAPDYSNPDHWAALPFKTDPSDKIAGDTVLVINTEAPVDVFFVHPTTFTQQKNIYSTNANLTDDVLNLKTDRTSILFQASAFNNGTRVFAPRYRQAHFNNYFTKDKATAKQAFEIAYRDVEAAFVYYLKNYNQGRPFIIASHSQGTTHSIPLIKKWIDGQKLQDQLVAAYLVGIGVCKDTFIYIKPCSSPDETGCFTSWRTFKKGTELKEKKENILVTNPVSWSLDVQYVDKKEKQTQLIEGL
ncbi:MAG: DUF3089 domain-containing protein [Saprospiraceae bacterium]|nr:DUF3089 domain-containing protein [Saprospiraceae bacterium]